MGYNYILMKDKLNEDYRTAFEKVEMYAMAKNIDADTDSEMMMNLLDVLLTAQEDGTAAEKVIGTDVEKFCRSYFSDYTFRNRLREIPRMLYRLLFLVFVFTVIEVAFEMDWENFTLSVRMIDVSGYFMGLVGGGLIVAVLKIFVQPFVFRLKRFPMGIFYGIIAVLFVGEMIISVYIGEKFGIQLNLSLLFVLYLSGGYCFCYLVVRSIWRWKNTGSIRKKIEPFEKGDTFFKTSFQAEFKKQLVVNARKKYEKRNKKRVRKGLEPMSPQEFMKYLRRWGKKNQRVDVILSVSLVILLFSMVLREGITGTWLDALILMGVLFVVEIPAMGLFYLSFRGNEKEKQILNECEERGITIFEYESEEKYENKGDGGEE